MTSPLVVERLGFTWPSGSPALNHCTFSLPEAGLWMLVGGNGSGKSTLLRLIAGLLEPQRGRIQCPFKTALVFQNPDHQLLLPSCGTDLQLSLPEGLDRGQRQARVEAALAQVGLDGFQQRPIHTLSGGQKQRLAIAGALASEASLLLLDEPTALLDPTSQEEVLGLIQHLCSRLPAPLAALWITHRLEELERCDGAALMEAGQLGPWQEGRRLRERLERRLPPLPGGKAEG
ncbi:ABC transporter ATP-binding protein [Synechococcus sp. Cruz CV-v-12]|uniref:ABC transporter ATP-binding protein n=1 Tax=unclassified Synechococcus TaxID=2626047 RepID=UPI0037D9F8B1